MSSNVPNQASFLRTSRNFPSDLKQLTIEVDRAYIDIANAVNNREIGFYTTTEASLNGENWFVSKNQRQQGFRRIYTFSAAGNIAHGINTAVIGGFTAIYGTFTDGTVWYPLPYVDATAANNQISISVTSTNIVITAGGGTPPTISSGFVVLEWISQA